jgi:hypothetical protein
MNKRTIEVGDLVEHRNTHERGPAAETCDERCRLLVKRARLAEQWPTDEAFRRFAAKVADAVMAAIARGERVAAENWAHSHDCRCPLGCLPESRYRYPFDTDDSWTVRPAPELDLRNFYFGFGGATAGLCGVSESNPYYRLGAAYRRRFVRAESEAA